jgi:hypothetical protein
MWMWIIKVTMISLLLIFLLHSLYSFFKTTLTSPKLKDLVNKPQEKYNTIYNSLRSAGEGGIQNLGEDDNNTNTNTNTRSNSNPSSMKDELKKYLKELNISSNSNSNSNTENINTVNPQNESLNSVYSPTNIMSNVGANGISTRVNNVPNYMPNINSSNSSVAPDYATPSMSSSYASAYSSY